MTFLKPNKWKLFFTIILVLINQFIRSVIYGIYFHASSFIISFIISYFVSSILISYIDNKYKESKRIRKYTVAFIFLILIVITLHLLAFYILSKTALETFFT